MAGIDISLRAMNIYLPWQLDCLARYEGLPLAKAWTDREIFRLNGDLQRRFQTKDDLLIALMVCLENEQSFLGQQNADGLLTLWKNLVAVAQLRCELRRRKIISRVQVPLHADSWTTVRLCDLTRMQVRRFSVRKFFLPVSDILVLARRLPDRPSLDLVYHDLRSLQWERKSSGT